MLTQRPHERRREPRIECHLPVYFAVNRDGPQGRVESRLINASANGGLLEVDHAQALKINTRVVIVLAPEVLRVEGDHAILGAVVVRIASGTKTLIGVRFERMPRALRELFATAS